MSDESIGSGEFRDDRLDQRKLSILKAVIDDYIQSFEPVGSRTIAKKYPLGLSSATIRNEMADLEEMGYLCQPHTSAGRIPSNKGYRMYVDRMIELGEIAPEAAGTIISLLENKIVECSTVMKAAAQIISDITQCPAIAVPPSPENMIIKACQLVPVESGRALAVVVTETNVIKNRLIDISAAITPENLISLSAILNEKFAGKPADMISLVTINEIVKESGIDRNVLLPVVDGIIDCIHQFNRREIIKEGTANLFNFPEFKDVTKVREALGLLQDNDLLAEIVSESIDANNGLVVKIGSENELSAMSDYSVVTATYSIDGINLGTIGVLGPTRMDYSKVISSLEYVRKLLNNKMTDNTGG